MANLKQLDDGVQVTEATSASAVLPSGAGEATCKDATDTAAAPCLIPGFAQACTLIAAPYSCLVMETHRRHVALPPMYLNKKKTGIQEELNAELLKYSMSLKGVPLAYDGIKVLGRHGDIFDDQGYIHLNIEASFVVFKPRNGEKLLGVINKISVGHVGCLVHGCFNACVLKPAQLSTEQWRASGLRVGGSLTFEVFQLDADVAGVLLIRGRLERSRVEELVAAFSTARSLEEATEPDSSAVHGSTEDVAVPKPKKKKKKKDKWTSVEDESRERAGSEVTLDVNGNTKKKKKKKKDKWQESSEELPPPADLPGSDSSGYVSDKSSRKRKVQDDSNEPVAKKKKNK
uniref:DNA-directed RNA polymerase subunit n=1 Tax=Electrophorus electricus TaxID=8005 RepID=A0A4W4EFV1_ELEEL